MTQPVTTTPLHELPDQVLTEVERQRKYIRRMHLIRQPCPVCGLDQDVYEARGLKTEEEKSAHDSSADYGNYYCQNPQCCAKLRHSVYAFVTGCPWRWNVDKERVACIWPGDTGIDFLPLVLAAQRMAARLNITVKDAADRLRGGGMIDCGGLTYELVREPERPLPKEPKK